MYETLKCLSIHESFSVFSFTHNVKKYPRRIGSWIKHYNNSSKLRVWMNTILSPSDKLNIPSAQEGDFHLYAAMTMICFERSTQWEQKGEHNGEQQIKKILMQHKQSRLNVKALSKHCWMALMLNEWKIDIDAAIRERVPYNMVCQNNKC